MSVCAITTGDQDCQAVINLLRQDFILNVDKYDVNIIDLVIESKQGELKYIDIYFPYDLMYYEDRTPNLLDENNASHYQRKYELISVNNDNPNTGKITLTIQQSLLKINIEEVSSIVKEKNSLGCRIRISFSKSMSSGEYRAIRLLLHCERLSEKSDTTTSYALPLKYYSTANSRSLNLEDALFVQNLFVIIILPQFASLTNPNTYNNYKYYNDEYVSELMPYLECFYGEDVAKYLSKLPRFGVEFFYYMNDGTPALQPWRNLPITCVYQIPDNNIAITSQQGLSDEMKYTYVTWSDKGKGEATDNEVEGFRNDKKLFIDDDCVVYNYGKKIAELENSRQSYNIIECLIMNNGKCRPVQILTHIYPRSQAKENNNVIKKVATPIARLRDILAKYGIIVSVLRGGYYHLDESDFILVRKKNVINP